MKQHMGVWLPDHEQHLLEWMNKAATVIDGKGAYQWSKQKRCYDLLEQRGSPFRTAIDVGAHVGFWSIHMAKRFQRVHSFEPIAEHRECFVKNVMFDSSGLATAPRLALHPCALGDVELDEVALETEAGSSGNTGVSLYADALGIGPGSVCMESPDGVSLKSKLRTSHSRYPTDAQVVHVRTLDSFKITEVDFIKIDCEGYEYFVLMGGEKTIKRDRPVIMVEQKPTHGVRYGLRDQQAVELLESWGARRMFDISGDYCLAWV